MLGKIIFLVFLVYFLHFNNFAHADFKEDPIKSTQTKPVPVTEEFLKREGQDGPASPTFKISDIGKFMAKKPYEKAEEETTGEKEEKASSWWDDWFSWKDDNKEGEDEGLDLEDN
jgi:hypothetical protein